MFFGTWINLNQVYQSAALIAHVSTRLYYRPQWSCGKVMFLHLSVILFTGGSLSRGSLSRGVSIWESLSNGVSVQEGFLSRGSMVGRAPAGGTHPTERHSCSEKTSLWSWLIYQLSVGYWTVWLSGSICFCTIMWEMAFTSVWCVVMTLVLNGLMNINEHGVNMKCEQCS